MTKKSGFFKKFRNRFFGRIDKAKDTGILPASAPKPREKPISPPIVEKRLHAEKRDPYFIQIGFDFGTSYSKCICRDVMIDKAWVHLPPGSGNQEMPFLIPSTLLLQSGKFEHFQDPSFEYHRNSLNHIKIALEKVALQKWDDPALKRYIEALGVFSKTRLFDFVRICGVYLLGGALYQVRKDIKNRFPDFGSQQQDYMAVNLAIPVADAERPNVNALYQQVLSDAWFLADQIGGYPKISPSEVKELISLLGKNEQQKGLNDALFLFPEVSANVQGFVRSRVSSEGVYLFSDTGAGSVDQSVFIFHRQDEVERLTYLYANVLPLGSSQIEYRAASFSGLLDWQNLEMWRKKKESGETAPELRRARDRIENELSRGTRTTLAGAKKKLIVKEQLYSIRLIFGGGGHCDNPYMTGALKPFSGGLFPSGISPSTVGMPIPKDLDLGERGNRWMHRLSVAYGLSFTRPELVNFVYPKDVDCPKPEEIWNPLRELPQAPRKEDV